MPRRGAVVALLAAACCASCGSAKQESGIALHVPLLDSREVPLISEPATVDGNLLLTPVGVECGLTFLIGTHGEIDYPGQLCRLRLAVTNQDSKFHAFPTADQRLVDTGGAAVAPDRQAMTVKRQDEAPRIGATDTSIVALYFALPRGHTPKLFRLHGDDDPTGIGTSVTTTRRPGGVVLDLPKAALYPPKPVF